MADLKEALKTTLDWLDERNAALIRRPLESGLLPVGYTEALFRATESNGEGRYKFVKREINAGTIGLEHEPEFSISMQRKLIADLKLEQTARDDTETFCLEKLDNGISPVDNIRIGGEFRERDDYDIGCAVESYKVIERYYNRYTTNGLSAEGKAAIGPHVGPVVNLIAFASAVGFGHDLLNNKWMEFLKQLLVNGDTTLTSGQLEDVESIADYSISICHTAVYDPNEEGRPPVALIYSIWCSPSDSNERSRYEKAIHRNTTAAGFKLAAECFSDRHKPRKSSTHFGMPISAARGFFAMVVKQLPHLRSDFDEWRDSKTATDRRKVARRLVEAWVSSRDAAGDSSVATFLMRNLYDKYPISQGTFWTKSEIAAMAAGSTKPENFS